MPECDSIASDLPALALKINNKDTDLVIHLNDARLSTSSNTSVVSIKERFALGPRYSANEL
jgi:hypothetical protein